MDQISYYQSFASRVAEFRRGMRDALLDLKKQGHRIAAYGAAAKGIIMLNYLGIGGDVIDYVVDRNVHKQGKFLPGVQLPIADPAKLLETMPNYVLILPWNFKDEIMEQQAEYPRRGGRFIIPGPNPQII
jgi:hypothetical protein